MATQTTERIYAVKYTRAQGGTVRRFYGTEWRAQAFRRRLASYGYASELLVTNAEWRRVR